MHNYLDFEKPIAELEGKIEELEAVASATVHKAIEGIPFLSKLPADIKTALKAKIDELIDTFGVSDGHIDYQAFVKIMMKKDFSVDSSVK